MSKRPISDIVSAEEEERRRVRLRVEAERRFRDLLLPEIQYEIADWLVSMTYQRDNSGRSIMSIMNIDGGFYLAIQSVMRRHVNAQLDAAKAFFRTWEAKVSIDPTLMPIALDEAKRWGIKYEYLIVAILFQHRAGVMNPIPMQDPALVPMAPHVKSLTDVYLLTTFNESITSYWKKVYPNDPVPVKVETLTMRSILKQDPWEFMAINYWTVLLRFDPGEYMSALQAMDLPLVTWLSTVRSTSDRVYELCRFYLGGRLATVDAINIRYFGFVQLESFFEEKEARVEAYARLFPTIMDLARFALRIQWNALHFEDEDRDSLQLIASLPPRAAPAKDPAPARLVDVMPSIDAINPYLWSTWLQVMYPAELTLPSDRARFLAVVRRQAIKSGHSTFAVASTQFVRITLLTKLSWDDLITLITETTPDEVSNDPEIKGWLVTLVSITLVIHREYTLEKMRAYVYESRVVEPYVPMVLHAAHIVKPASSAILSRLRTLKAILSEMMPPFYSPARKDIDQFLSVIKETSDPNLETVEWRLESGPYYGVTDLALAMKFYEWRSDRMTLNMWFNNMELKDATFRDRLLAAGLTPTSSHIQDDYIAGTWMPSIKTLITDRNPDIGPTAIATMAIDYLSTPNRILQWLFQSSDDINDAAASILKQRPAITNAALSTHLLNMFFYSSYAPFIDLWFEDARLSDTDPPDWSVKIFQWAGLAAATQAGMTPLALVESLESLYATIELGDPPHPSTKRMMRLKYMLRALQDVSRPRWSDADVDAALAVFQPPPL